MAFTRPNNDVSIWRSKGDTLVDSADEVKSELDRLLNDGTTDVLALIDELEASSAASDIGATAFGSITEETVQGQIEQIQANIDSIVAGIIPDGSIDEEKLQNNSVSTEKIVDGAVTEEKIADGVLYKAEIGEIRHFFANFDDEDYLLCDGSVYDKEDYPLLADVLFNDFLYRTQVIKVSESAEESGGRFYAAGELADGIITTGNDGYSSYVDDETGTVTAISGLPSSLFSGLATNGSDIAIATSTSSTTVKPWKYSDSAWSVLSTFPTKAATSVIVYGNGTWLIYYSSNMYRSVDDGVTWTTTSISFVPTKIVYGNDIFLAVNSTMNYVSFDSGVTWTEVGFGSTGACYGDGIFFMTSSEYSAMTEDFENYSEIANPLTSTNLAYGNGHLYFLNSYSIYAYINSYKAYSLIAYDLYRGPTLWGYLKDSFYIYYTYSDDYYLMKCLDNSLYVRPPSCNKSYAESGSQFMNTVAFIKAK